MSFTKMICKGKIISTAAFILSGLLLITACFNPLEEYKRYRYGVEKGVRLEGRPVEKMLEKELKEMVARWAFILKEPPRSAFIARDTGEVIPEKEGKFVHASLTVKEVLEAEPGSNVEVQRVRVAPEKTAELLNSIEETVGYYHTYVSGGSGRVENVILATRALDRVLLSPGETFSFNQTVGPRTMERGYRLAPIIVGNSVVPGRGGGICQVSSTLYNAVLQAELEVVERSPHSRSVDYVPPGRDATVSDFIDFKFKNNTNSYLMIKTSAPGSMISVSILSS